jgi:hypothetical protein
MVTDDISAKKVLKVAFDNGCDHLALIGIPECRFSNSRNRVFQRFS